MEFSNISIYELVAGIFNSVERLYIFGFSTIENYLSVVFTFFTCLSFVLVITSVYRIYKMTKKEEDISEEVTETCKGLVPCLLCGLIWPVAIPGFLGMGWGIFFPRTAHLDS